MEQLSLSGRFIAPFVELLSQYQDFPSHKLARVQSKQQDRVAVNEGYETLTYWVRRTADEDLGLKAGTLMVLGRGGALEYAMHSAGTVRESTAVAKRYARLFSDTLRPSFEIDGNRALVRLDNSVAWPRVAADFTMSGWYTCHIRSQLIGVRGLECWFAHDKPASSAEYERVFAPVALRFNAPCYGFAFDVDCSEAPLVGSDPILHALHCEHLEVLLSGLIVPRDFAARVRDMLVQELPGGRPTARGVAHQLSMSRRTLARRLDEESTSFTGQLDELRHQLALRYVACAQIPLNDVSSLLGFSQLQSFYRAFKRWTGQTPVQYRQGARQLM